LIPWSLAGPNQIRERSDDPKDDEGDADCFQALTNRREVWLSRGTAPQQQGSPHWDENGFHENSFLFVG
jgi:hypothetical protein